MKRIFLSLFLLALLGANLIAMADDIVAADTIRLMYPEVIFETVTDTNAYVITFKGTDETNTPWRVQIQYVSPTLYGTFADNDFYNFDGSVGEGRFNYIRDTEGINFFPFKYLTADIVYCTDSVVIDLNALYEARFGKWMRLLIHATAPVPVDEEPLIPTIDPAVYYISDFVDGQQYLAECLAETATEGWLAGWQYEADTEPASDCEFVFVEVEGKQAIFTIRDKFGRYLCQNGTDGTFRVAESLPQTGAEWRVEAEYVSTTASVVITNTETDAHIAYIQENQYFSCRSDETANRVILVNVKDIPSADTQARQETKPLKVIENGQLVILREGNRYNMMGMPCKNTTNTKSY